MTGTGTTVAAGAWGRYVLDEVIPQTQRRFHTDPRRVALGGVSMGGFGAYDLMLHSAARFCAVAATRRRSGRPAGKPPPARSTTPRTLPATT